MPNWVTNTAVFVVPQKNANALKQDLSGPSDWPIPQGAFNEHEREKAEMSNHAELAFLGEAPALLAQFHKAHAPLGWPGWLPPSIEDLKKFHADPAWRALKTVPLSVPRLAAFKDLADFQSYLGAETTPSGLYKRPSDGADIIGIRRAHLGIKWPPSSVELREEWDFEAKVGLEFRYETPWSPIVNPGPLFQEVLKKHNAKLLIKWVEEQGYSGYFIIDPSAERYDQEEFGPDTFNATDPENEDFITFSSDAFEERVAAAVDDPDFF